MSNKEAIVKVYHPGTYHALIVFGTDGEVEIDVDIEALPVPVFVKLLMQLSSQLMAKHGVTLADIDDVHVETRMVGREPDANGLITINEEDDDGQ